VGLFDIDANDNQPIDTYTFGPQAADVSEGRCPDGSTTWVSFASPTPSATNSPCGTEPVISKVNHNPLPPSATDEVTVTSIIVDDDETAITATLWYSTGVGFTAIPMTPIGANVYTATIPAQPDNTIVAYYIQAENDQEISVINPPGAPIDAYHYTVGYQPPPLLINEFVADNVTTLEDPDEPGEFPDWIELYNAGPDPVDLSGRYLTDNLTDPTKFRIPDGLTIPAGGFILFYADNDPGQGPLHLNFRLNKTGEAIGLFDSDATGNRPIDTYTFGWQAADVSEHRHPNGGDTWIMTRTPSPGTADVVVSRPPYLPMVLRQTLH